MAEYPLDGGKEEITIKKRWKWALFILLLLLLCGAAGWLLSPTGASAGIIGGADGPTTIIISK